MATRSRSTAHVLLVVVTALAALACTPAPPPDPLDARTSADMAATTTPIDGDGPDVTVDQLDPPPDELLEPSDAEQVDAVGEEPTNEELDPAEGESANDEPGNDEPANDEPGNDEPGNDEPGPGDDGPGGDAPPPSEEPDAAGAVPGAEDEAPGTTETELGDAGMDPSPELPEVDADAGSAARSIVPVPHAPAPLPASGSTVAAQAEPGDRVVLDVGHVDLIEVTRSGERLVVSVKDDTDPSGVVFRRPSDVQSRVRDGARTQVPPGDAFEFLGAPGRHVWLLPQVQDPQLLWPGWSTERLGAGQVDGNAVTMRLRSVDGPGRVHLFTTDQFGAPNRLFGPGTSDELVVPINTHAHANWAFSAPGTYRLTFEVGATIAGGPATSTEAEYVFLVGDDTPPVPWDSIADAGPGGGGPGGGGPGGGGPGDVPDGPDGGAGSAPGDGSAGVGGTNGGDVRDAGVSAAGNTAGGGGQGALARTGGDAGGLLLVGLGLVAMGVTSAGIGRRRRRRTPLIDRA